MEPVAEEVARIASRLPENEAAALLWYARRLERGGREGPLPPLTPLAFPYPLALGAILFTLLLSAGDAVAQLVGAGTLRIHVLVHLSCVVAGVSFLLLNTRMVQEAVKAVPASAAHLERADAFRALRWRLWRPLIFCLPLAGVLVVLLIAKWAR